jgi:hypothetical protein
MAGAAAARRASRERKKEMTVEARLLLQAYADGVRDGLQKALEVQNSFESTMRKMLSSVDQLPPPKRGRPRKDKK